MNRIWKYAVAAMLLGVILYLAAYFYTVRSEAFQFARVWALESEQIDRVVGRVTEVRVDPLGGFTHRFSGSDRDASIVVVVVGEEGSTRIDLDLQKRKGNWTITKATTVDH